MCQKVVLMTNRKTYHNVFCISVPHAENEICSQFDTKFELLPVISSMFCILIGEQNFAGGTRPVLRLLPPVRHVYPVL